MIIIKSLFKLEKASKYKLFNFKKFQNQTKLKLKLKMFGIMLKKLDLM